MARIIKGIPTSWDPSIVNRRFPWFISIAVWSPCSRFIATSYTGVKSVITILDAVTLEQLHTMHLPQTWSYITFSPGTHLLTAQSQNPTSIVSWDFQTGGIISTIRIEGCYSCSSVSYSECETMIGTLFDKKAIHIYNVQSGTHISSHSINQSISEILWTHGEYLQFAVVNSRSITIWHVSFTSGHSPKKVGPLSTPDNFSPKGLVLLPTLSRIAFIVDWEVVVWDAQHHKVLLHFEDVENNRGMSFSPDGKFFIYGTRSKKFQVWKESPIGYSTYHKFVPNSTYGTLNISPNGESAISHGDRKLQLWHMANSPAPLSDIPMQNFQLGGELYLDFSPDESLVAITARFSSTITILDTKSDNLWLVIDTGTKSHGLRMTKDKVILVGDGKIVTWDLPSRDCVFNTRRNIDNSVQVATLKQARNILHASISPNLSYIAIRTYGKPSFRVLSIDTGEELVGVNANGVLPGFGSNGHHLWCATYAGKVHQWRIIEENGTNSIKLEELGKNMKPQKGFPWNPSCGYQVTDDGWILCSSGKRLLWLPYLSHPDHVTQRKWSGKFLAVWNNSSSEPFILELKV